MIERLSASQACRSLRHLLSSEPTRYCATRRICTSAEPAVGRRLAAAGFRQPQALVARLVGAPLHLGDQREPLGVRPTVALPVGAGVLAPVVEEPHLFPLQRRDLGFDKGVELGALGGHYLWQFNVHGTDALLNARRRADKVGFLESLYQYRTHAHDLCQVGFPEGGRLCGLAAARRQPSVPRDRGQPSGVVFARTAYADSRRAGAPPGLKLGSVHLPCRAVQSLSLGLRMQSLR